jgi:hypothetical protein
LEAYHSIPLTDLFAKAERTLTFIQRLFVLGNYQAFKNGIFYGDNDSWDPLK